MTRFAAVGFTCIDVYKNLNFRYPTGNGIDLMFNLMDQVKDLQPSVVTAIGDDDNGRLLIGACGRRNVDTGHVTVVEGAQTAEVEMLLNGKERVHHKANKGVMITYQPSGADMDFIRAQDYIHTDLSWSVVDLLADMRRQGAKVYFDFSKRYQHPDVERVLRNIDYGIFSFDEETQAVRELLIEGCKLGARVLLATFGENGSLACDGAQFYRQASIPPVDLVNTVGAGDAFGAGFMGGILLGRGIEACMRMGAEKASEIISIFEPYPMREDEESFKRREGIGH